MTLGLREQHKYRNFRNLITINCKWRGDCITDGYVSFAEYVVRASWYFWEEYLLPIFKSSRYSVIFLRFTFQLLSFCDLWSECGSEVTGLRKIIWDLLFLSYSSNLMFVAIVPTALALIIFVSLSWVKNWTIKSQCDKNKGIYPWFKLGRWDMCITLCNHNSQLYHTLLLFTYHILRCQDFGIFWPPTYDTIEEIPLLL